MYNLLSLLIGAIIAIMVAVNGELSGSLGNYFSLIIIHLLGFLTILGIMLFKKIKISFRNGLPLYLYSAGAISVFTVMFNNLSYSALGVSLPIALGLLGQILTSLAFDHYGILGMPRIRFKKKKIVGLLIIVIGISIMTFL
jgi:bacterial/archaeal transporter family-2 protein